MSTPTLFDGLAYYTIFVFSATIHEAAHAWMAKRGGDLTAYHEGQVSIDPMPHIKREPIGMVVLPLISILLSGWPLGFASAPYDQCWADRYPKKAATMALAGPGANLFVVFVTGLILSSLVKLGIFYSPHTISFGKIAVAESGGFQSAAAFLLGLLFCQNLLLFVFNMLPFPPLDGSGAMPLLLSEKASATFRQIIADPAVGLFGLLIAWKIFDVLFHPIFLGAVNFIYPDSHYR